MRIAISCRSILKQNSTGIGRYTYQLINSLGHIDTTNEYYLYAAKRLFDRKRKLPIFSAKNFLPKRDYFNRGFFPTVGPIDVCHIPSPEYINLKKSPVVVTIHDLIYKTYPQSHPQDAINILESQMKSIVTHADHLICISHATRRDLHKFYDIPQEKTSVIYNGVNHQMFNPVTSAEEGQVKDVLNMHGIDRPYFLYVGTIEPRKNLQGILQALEQLKQKNNFNGYLVVVGMKGWMIDHIEPMIKKLQLEQMVKFLGFVTDSQLRMLYNQCQAFVFPSLYEGFGFPIVEAFACKAPVITSNTSSCVEIAGEAALTIDPNNVDDLRTAMNVMLNDNNKRQHFIDQGFKRAQTFSFDQTAKETLNVYSTVKRSG